MHAPTLNKEKLIHWLSRGLLLIILCSLPIVMIIMSKTGLVGQLSEGDVALKDIYAPLDFTYQGPIDEEETQKARVNATRKISEIYNLKQLALDEGLFRNLAKRIRLKAPNISQIYSRTFNNNYFLKAEDKKRFSEAEAEEITVFDSRKKTSKNIPITEIKTVKDARKQIEKELGKEFKSKKDKDIVLDLITASLVPNIIFDAEQTAKKKAEAKDAVAPIYKQVNVKDNELIISKGQILTQGILKKLNASHTSRPQQELISFNLGMSILMIMFIIISAAFLKIYYPKVYSSNKELTLLAVLFLSAIILGKFVELSPYSSFIVPVAAFSMAYFMLTNDAAMSFVLAALLSMVLGISFSNNIGLLIIFFIGSIAGVTAVSKVRRRNQILQAGLLVGSVQFISILAWGLFNNLEYAVILEQAGWGVIGGILSAVILMVILPLLEGLFSLITNITLLELSDFNQPLLKDMVLKAPGTYHHSLLVGNLSETAAEAIGANSLLARVGAYFHDVGKIDKAEYFSENQSQPESKHDVLNPSMSKLVIINHVKEGQEIARKYKLKKPIINFIAQHHGTSLVYYFYRRALEDLKKEDDIKEDVFRYPGPKPQNKETAICLLADSVEAATRSIEEPTSPKIEDAVHKVINNKFIDGQLDECDLTLKDLEKIAKVFTHILTGIYHSRVVYPEKKNGSVYKESPKQASSSKGNSKADSKKNSL
ncbi:MAG: HDIG domain-containing protein [Candidatus Omnitrophica bacterium]|nr:HDIG domain-containing protein [Candidatus Omnitrophota bacterium]